MNCINKLNALGFNFSIIDGKISYEYQGSNNPNIREVKPLLEELKENKEKAIKHIESLLFKSVFNDFTYRMNTLDGWSIELSTWLVTYDNELYNEWTEAEYLVDEAWGLESIDRFKTVLLQFEQLCLRILNEWNERYKNCTDSNKDYKYNAVSDNQLISQLKPVI